MPRESRLENRLVFDHLSKTLDRAKFYSCPAELLSLTTLTGYLEAPATKRQRGAGDGLVGEIDLLDQADGSTADQAPGTGIVLYFQLLHSSIGKKKIVSTSIGAGGRLQEERIFASVHNRLTGFADKVMLNSRAAAADPAAGPAFVLTGFGGDNFLTSRCRRGMTCRAPYLSNIWMWRHGSFRGWEFACLAALRRHVKQSHSYRRMFMCQTHHYTAALPGQPGHPDKTSRA